MTTYVPNTFATPNAIIDVLMPLLTDSEFRVLMFITRQILGWEKSRVTNKARISQSIMEKGYAYQDKQGNEQQIPGCGLSKNPIRDALKSLQKYRIIEAIGEPTSDGQEWEFILLTKDNPDIAGLKLRQANKSQKSKKQTEKARENNPKLQGGISSTNTPEGGELTNTGGISSTNSQGVSSTNTNETNKETNKETHTIADEPQPVASLEIAKQETKVVDTPQDVSKHIALLETITVVTPYYLTLLKEDAKLYNLEEWGAAIAIVKDRMREQSIKTPYKYLLGVLKSRAIEAKNAPPPVIVPYHQPPKLPDTNISEDEQKAALDTVLNNKPNFSKIKLPKVG